MKKTPKVYVEHGFHIPRIRLDDEEYGRSIQAHVVYCVDAAIVNRERRTIYLGKRVAKPLQGWWILGGRVFPGELEADAIARKYKQEAGIDVAPERFEYVDTFRYMRKGRAQAPQEYGSDCIGYTFAVELTDDELAMASSNLDPTEYDAKLGLAEFTRGQLIAEGVDQAVVDIYDAIFNNDN